MKRHIDVIFNFITKTMMWVMGIVMAFLAFISYNVSSLFSMISLIVSCIFFSWRLFDLYLWKFFTKKPIISKFLIPDISGRWEGVIIRDNESHDFVLEIDQTYTSISCYAYHRHGTSTSSLGDILRSENRNHYKLHFYWSGQTTSGDNSGTFEGVSILDIILQPQKQLIGHYYTDRTPNQTRGTMNLSFVGETTFHKFNIEQNT